MRFYVMANENTVHFETDEAARLFAYSMLNDNKVEYLEYGLENPEKWLGKLTLVVFKGDPEAWKLYR